MKETRVQIVQLPPPVLGSRIVIRPDGSDLRVDGVMVRIGEEIEVSAGELLTGGAAWVITKRRKDGPTSLEMPLNPPGVSKL